jgi:hypothetical protein
MVVGSSSDCGGSPTKPLKVIKVIKLKEHIEKDREYKEMMAWKRFDREDEYYAGDRAGGIYWWARSVSNQANG